MTFCQLRSLRLPRSSPLLLFWCVASLFTLPRPQPPVPTPPLDAATQTFPHTVASHGYIDTADSDLMHHQYRLSVIQWNPGPARRNPTNTVSAACGKFHAFKKPVIMSRTSLISSQRRLATRTSLSCSTRTPLSLTLRCLSPGRAPQVNVHGAWFTSSFEHCCAPPHLPGHQLSHFAQYTFTMSWPRNVMHPLSGTEKNTATKHFRVKIDGHF